MGYLRKLIMSAHETRVQKGIEYTPAEIERQPREWIKNFEMLRKREDEVRSFMKSRIFSGESPRVILSGAGSSAFIGLACQNLLRQKWGVDVETRATTDIVTHWHSTFLKKATNTMVSFSRSGNSPESLGSIILADQFCEKMNHIIVTCNKEGRLAKMTNEKQNALPLILSEETNDKGLAMTCSFTTMLMTAQFLACINELDKYEQIVKDLSKAATRLLDDYSDIVKEISETGFNRAFFLGSGCLHGCAVESSLKLQEMTAGRAICKADTFMGVRHGPMASIDDRTVVVYFLSTDPFVRKYELDLMKEIDMKGIGMRKVVVCDRIGDELKEYIDYAIEFDENNELSIPDFYRPIIDVTVGQMMGLFKSLDLKLKPDNPSERGIISRVVSGVKIYDYASFNTYGTFVVLPNL